MRTLAAPPERNLMSVCPHCHASLSIDAPTAHSGTAPSGRWISLARFAHLAEAGYFADLLLARGIETQVHEGREFDAVRHHWHSSFVLQVRDADTAEAADALDQELGGDEREPRYTLSQETRPAPNVPGWMPLALLLAVGGVAYCSSRLAVPRAATPPSTALWDALAESQVRWVVDDPQGRPARVMWYDPARRCMFLSEDVDGDGRHDRQRRFDRLPPGMAGAR